MKKAFAPTGAEPTERMRRFGKYLQELRAASDDDLTDAIRENRRARMETDDHYFQEGTDDRMPESFAAREQLARRLGVKTKSLRQVAAALGISKNTVHDYEMGKKYPSAEFVYEFCAVLENPPTPRFGNGLDATRIRSWQGTWNSVTSIALSAERRSQAATYLTQRFWRS